MPADFFDDFGDETSGEVAATLGGGAAPAAPARPIQGTRSQLLASMGAPRQQVAAAEVEEAPEYETAVDEEQAWEPEPHIPPSEMSDTKRRFYKAQLYMQVADSPLFDDADEVAAEVSAECRAFFEQRMAESMAGVTKTGDSALLTPEHMQILALVANAILRNPKIQAAFGIAPTEMAAVPALPPPPPPPPPKKPQVRARALGTKPQPQVQQRPRPQAAAPQAKPPVVKPGKRPGEKKPIAPPKVAQRKQNAVSTTAELPTSSFRSKDVPPDGTFLENDAGQRFKVKHIQMLGADEYGEQHAEAIENLGTGQTYKLPSGIQVYREADGQLWKVVHMSLNTQTMTRTPQQIPFPASNHMMARASHLAASDADANRRGKDAALSEHFTS